MPRKPTGQPQWKAIAVKLPETTLDELRRYSDLHHVSISTLIREGLAMRLQGAPQSNEYNSNTTLPASTVALVTRLADMLTSAAGQLRSVCEQPTAAESRTADIPNEPQEYNGNTQYNSNTSPHENLVSGPVEASRTDITNLPFDTTKYILGKLCRGRHEWGNSGKTLLLITNHTCTACQTEGQRQRREAKRRGARA